MNADGFAAILAGLEALTDAEIARRARVHRSTVGRIRGGLSPKPSYETVTKLAAVSRTVADMQQKKA